MAEGKATPIRDDWLVSDVPGAPSVRGTQGQYQLCFELGSGSLGTVYLARYEGAPGFERVVAVKRMYAHLAREPRIVEAFWGDARVAARIDHPFACRVLEVGKTQDTHYLAMEYIRGEPLSAIFQALAEEPQLRRDPAYPELVARIVADLCEGLHAAHELSDHGELLGLVHRDINPANLFLLYDGTVRVADFGLANAHERSHQTGASSGRGTYAYMSPEQLQGERVDRRSDVWSLGVVMWELLTGRRLFERDTPGEIFRAVAWEAVPPPSEARPGLPVDLDAVVLRACAHAPQERHATAREMARELERFLGNWGRSVSRGEVAEWLEALFPGSGAYKESLMAQTRLGGGDPDTPPPAPAREPASVQAAGPVRSGMRPAGAAAPAASEDTDPAAEPDRPAAPSEGSMPAARGAPKRGASQPPGSDASSGRGRRVVGTLAALAALVTVGIFVWSSLAPWSPPEPPAASGAEGQSGASAVPPRPSYGAGGGPSSTAGSGAGLDYPPSAPSAPVGGADGGAGGDMKWHKVGAAASADDATKNEDDNANPSDRRRRRHRQARRQGGRSGRKVDVGPGEGKLHITIPNGTADVQLDGEQLGRTPTTLTLPAGTHMLDLRPVDGGPTRQVRAQVKEGRRLVLSVTL